MSRLQIRLGLFTGFALILCAPASAWQVDAYFAEKIWTGEGEPIQDAVLLVIDGKVRNVGPQSSVVIPIDARRHQLDNRSIMPGIVIAQTQLSGSQDVERTLTPQNRAIDGFDFFADHSAYLESGITSVQISAGKNRLMPGVGAVVKLSGDDLDKRLLSENESLRIVLDASSRKPPRIFEPPVGPVSEDRPLEPTQPQLSKTLAGSLAGLRLLFQNIPVDRTLASSNQDEIIAAVAAHLNSSGVIRFSAKTAPEIRGAINLAKQFGLNIVLADCQDLEPFVDDFDDWSQFVNGVVLQGLSPGKITNPSPEVAEKQKLPWKHARELVDAGIPVAVRPSVDTDLEDIFFVAGQFMKDGLDPSELVSMLTSAPAKMMGVDDRIGRLDSGKDADFVVLSNDPFALRSAVMATYVDGQSVFDRQSKTKTTVVRVDRVYTGDGHFVDDASIVIKGKTVRGIGKDVSAPVDAEVRNFTDAVVVPGYVDLGTGLGVGGTLTGSITLKTKLGEQLYPDDPAIKFARKHGVTTVLLGSMSSSNGTPLVAYKLGDDVRVIADPAAIRFRIGDSTASSMESLEKALKAGKAYHDSFIKYEEDLAAYEKKKAEAEAAARAEAAAKAKAEADAKKAEKPQPDDDKKKQTDGDEKDAKQEKPEDKPADDEKEKPVEKDKDGEQKGDQSDADKKDDKSTEGEKKDADKKTAEKKKDEPPKKPKLNEALEPYRALLTGEIPALVEARKAPAIEQAVKLFVDKYKVRTVIVGADDLARLPNLLEDREVGVCAGPEMTVTIDKQKTNLPQLLANERIKFGFQSKGTTGVGQLPAAIQYSVSQGLGVEDGLVALTSAPAELLSDKMTFGSLAAGKDADLIVLSGPPFEPATTVLAVMIDGVWVYDREEQK